MMKTQAGVFSAAQRLFAWYGNLAQPRLDIFTIDSRSQEILPASPGFCGTLRIASSPVAAMNNNSYSRSWPTRYKSNQLLELTRMQPSIFASRQIAIAFNAPCNIWKTWEPCNW